METSLAEVTPIKKEHGSIAEEFLIRVQGMLNTSFKIKKYAIEDDWRQVESLELQVTEKEKLQIQLVREK